MSAPGPAEFDVTEHKRGWLSPVSLVWLVPFLALVVALGIAWQSYSKRGPVIEISFENAEGVAEGATQLRYRNVKVGEVEGVHFSKDLTQVIVSVRVDKDIAPYIDSKAEFWIVRPQVSARGITGLETVLSGVFIEGSWDSSPGGHTSQFDGLARAPLVTSGEEGTEFTVRAPDGGRLQSGAPIVYKGIHVGLIDQPELTKSGDAVIARAFVKSPYDRNLTTATRFWDTSGVTFDVGLGGVSLKIASLASLIEGGLSFEKLGSGGSPIGADHVYNIFETENDARSSIFVGFESQGYPFSILFEESVSGLSAGAPVEYRGVRVGTVTGLSGNVVGEGAERHVDLRADISLQPTRLGLFEDATDQDMIDFVSQSVQRGVRAKLVRQGLLSGKLKIEFVELTDAEPAELDTDFKPAPLIPSVHSDMPALAATAEGMMKRIDDLPIEQLMNSVTNVATGIERLVTSKETMDIPNAVTELLDNARDLVSEIPAKQIADNTEQLLVQLREIASQFNDQEAIDSLLATLDRADEIAQTIQKSADQLPGLITQLNELVTKTTNLPIETIVAEASKLLETAQAFVGSDELASIPTSINSAVTDVAVAAENVRSVTDSFIASDALAPVLDALKRTDAIAASIESAGNELPGLLQEIQALAAKANALPLDQLVVSATNVVDSAEAVISSEAVAELPTALSSALSDLTAALADVKTVTERVSASGAIDSMLAALERTDTIAASVEASTQNLPTLMQEIEKLAATASALPLNELVASADDVLNSANAIVGSPEAAQLPASLKASLDEVNAALADVKSVTGKVATSGSIDNLLKALDRTDSIAASVQTSAQELPALLKEIDALAAKANSLPLDELVSSASSVLESANAIVGTEAATQLPASLDLALDEFSLTVEQVRAVISQVEESGAVDSLLAALKRTDAIAASVESTTAGLPDLLKKVDDLAAKADALPLTELVSSADELVQSADALVSSPDTAKIPAALASALDELGAALQELREGGAVENTNRALAAASSTMRAVENAANELPDLTTRIEGLATQAESVLATYGARSEFNSQTVGALRDLRDAARAITSLARTIERKPNSLLIGR